MIQILVGTHIYHFALIIIVRGKKEKRKKKGVEKWNWM